MTTIAPPIRRPLAERFNLRIVTFVAVFAFLLGVPAYIYLETTLTGGIKKQGDYYVVELKAMSTFPFDQEDGRIEDVPKRWRELNGKTVEMVGEVAPGSTTATGVDQKFDLVYSVAKCCFTGTPQIQHFVKVTVPPSAEVKLTSEGSMQVRGTLKVDVTRDPETGKVTGVYHVTADRIASM